MTYEYANSFSLKHTLRNRRYHKTLRSYENLEELTFDVRRRTQYVDFLAGVYSSKIKFNKEYIFDMVKEFNKIYLIFIGIYISAKFRESLSRIIEGPAEIEKFFGNFNQAFDEVILNKLLKPINTIFNITKYCVLIYKNNTEVPYKIPVKYTCNGKESRALYDVPSEYPPQLAGNIIDKRTMGITDCYSNLPILLINTPCVYNFHDMYDAIYPPVEEVGLYDGKSRRRRSGKKSKRRRSKSKRRKKSKRRRSKINNKKK
jgi:hypothetical protein